MTVSRKRKSEIVRWLSEMSRNGWANARIEDYQPLERELRGWEPLQRMSTDERN
jgi:hypothetical protein